MRGLVSIFIFADKLKSFMQNFRFHISNFKKQEVDNQHIVVANLTSEI
jgi:hypothetical protein